MDLARLIQLVPPPARPAATGSRPEWEAAGRALGSGLPDDYRALIGTYGAGRFDDFLVVFSPFTADGPGNLLHERQAVLDGYRRRRRAFPHRFPLPAHPEPGGLLPLGRTDNGDELFWLTTGHPERWAVVTFEARSADPERFPGGVVAFLVALFSGSERPSWLPEELSSLAHRFVPDDDTVPPADAPP